MLEDRVRLNWAIRAFFWMVTVPPNRVQAKLEQYRVAPDTGSVTVKDSSETWDAVAPSLRANDASYDLKAVRPMIQAASYPPNWISDSEDVNLATTTAIDGPALRHLRRRQLTLRHMLLDLAHTVCVRVWEVGALPARPGRSSIQVTLPDLSRADQTAPAGAAHSVAQALAALHRQLGGAASNVAGPGAATWPAATIQAFVLEGIRAVSEHLPRILQAAYNCVGGDRTYDLAAVLQDVLAVEYAVGWEPPAYVQRWPPVSRFGCATPPRTIPTSAAPTRARCRIPTSTWWSCTRSGWPGRSGQRLRAPTRTPPRSCWVSMAPRCSGPNRHTAARSAGRWRPRRPAAGRPAGRSMARTPSIERGRPG